MAAQHLTSLSSPNFPQVFAALIDREITRVSQLLAQSQLTQCFFEDEYCDCRERATVHHLASEQEFCLRHFQAVERG